MQKREGNQVFLLSFARRTMDCVSQTTEMRRVNNKLPSPQQEKRGSLPRTSKQMEQLKIASDFQKGISLSADSDQPTRLDRARN